MPATGASSLRCSIRPNELRPTALVRSECGGHPGSVDTQQLVQSPLSTRCCGSDPTVVALTRDDAPRSRVELVRCGGCGQSSWRLDGRQVPKEQALGELSAAYAPATPARKATTVRSRSKPAQVAPAQAPAPPAELSDLLAGWQVLGSH